MYLYELYIGALRSGQGGSIEDITRELRYNAIAPFDFSAAEEAAEIQTALADRGELINPLDILIAGIARSEGMTLVAVDRDFERVPDLSVHNPKTEG